MQKYKKNNKRVLSIAAFLLSLFIIMSSVQGFLKIESTNKNYEKSPMISNPVISPVRDSTYEWIDDFFDSSKIEDSLSYNYDLDVVHGIVKMKNTYEAWGAYPEWERMKKILITNSGSDLIEDYVIDLIINYDSDMQSDFDDIRFANENGFPLTYWLGGVIMSDSAKVLVRIPELPGLQTTNIYMFYGNPLVDDESDENIFIYNEITGEDLRLSWTLQSEGAWDPDVSYGADKFIVAWEEGAGPGYSPDQTHRLIPRQIHVRLMDIDGSNPIPDYPDDIDISTTSSSNYHAENPSISFSEDSGKFLVVWDENPTLFKYAVGIKGAFINAAGVDFFPFTIQDPLNIGLQYYPCRNPCVAYDELSNRFFVVYSKTDSNWNYDVVGKFYGSNGGHITPPDTVYIGTGSDYQGQPWVCSDNQGHFMVVYEEGSSATNGPFDLKARLYEYDGDPIGGVIDVATGLSSLDNIFPSVSYNEISEEYLITWNTGDVSSGDYNGAIKGQILSDIGTHINTISIQTGNAYKIANPVPYLGSRFFVTYDDDYANLNSIWCRLVFSGGLVMSNRPKLSDDLDFEKRYANSVSGGGNVFVAWEDDRYSLNIPPTEIRGSIWNCSQSVESLDVTYVFGNEEELILESKIVSTLIEPEDFIEWDDFLANATYADFTSLNFDIVDINGTVVLMEDISPGEEIINITDPFIRLQAIFSRNAPTNTSLLDSWGVTALVGTDLQPPWTEAIFDPEDPDGNNGWYVSSVDINMNVYDNDTAPENITTYYKINDDEIEVYEPGSVVVLSIEGANNSFEYWSMDNAGNEELPHNVISDIKIDTKSPYITIFGPPNIVFPGQIHVNGTFFENTAGSGLDKLTIELANEIVYNVTYSGEYNGWFDWEFTADYGENYDIIIKASDLAGNIIEERRIVTCSERGIYETGYIYIMDYPKIGPINLLEIFETSIAFDYNSLYVVLPDFHMNASSVNFVAKNVRRDTEVSQRDTNLTDGCSVELELPTFGSHEIKAYVYDAEDVLLDEHLLISKIFVIISIG